MKTNVFFSAALLMVASLFTLSAQPPQDGERPQPPAMTIDAAMAEKLDVSIEQMSLIEQSQNETNLAKSMIEENEELSDKDKQKMMKELMEAQMEAYKEILTEEQYKKFEKLLKDTRPARGEDDENRPPRGEGGQGGGGRGGRM